MLETLKGMVPTNMEIETGTIVSVAGTCITYLCGWDDAMAAFLVLMALDYVTGVLAVIINPNMKPSSKRGFRGICKITEKIVEYKRTKQALTLLKYGKTLSEVAYSWGISEKVLNNYLPYTKGEYGSDTPSANALKIRASRQRSKANA